MPYTTQTWANGAGGLTPINALRLGHIEDGIEEATAVAEAAEFKFAQFLDMKAYGIVADGNAAGVGTDNAVALALFAADLVPGTIIVWPDVSAGIILTSKPCVWPGNVKLEGGGWGAAALADGWCIGMHSSAIKADWNKMGVITCKNYKNKTSTTICDPAMFLKDFKVHGTGHTFGNAFVFQNKQNEMENVRGIGFEGTDPWNTANGGLGSGYGVVHTGTHYDGTTQTGDASNIRHTNLWMETQNSKFYTNGNCFADGMITDFYAAIQPNATSTIQGTDLGFETPDIDIEDAAGWLVVHIHTNGAGGDGVRLRKVMNTRVFFCSIDGWGVAPTARVSGKVNSAFKIDAVIGGATLHKPTLLMSNNFVKFREEQAGAAEWVALWMSAVNSTATTTFPTMASIGNWTIMAEDAGVMGALGDGYLFRFRGGANVISLTGAGGGATTNGSTTLTTTGSCTAAMTGMGIYGPNIPYGCTVTFVDATHLTLSLPATGTASGGAFKVGSALYVGLTNIQGHIQDQNKVFYNQFPPTGTNGPAFITSEGCSWNVGDAAPTSGNWPPGTKRYFRNPVASGYIGTICCTPIAAAPGLWKNFGLIAA